MCGVCGIFAFNDGFDADERLVERMSDRMVHRGPDDGGTWASRDRRLAFGHRRLSIVDLSAAGHQPMTNEDGTVWITYNGEVYNHAKLRPELERKGHVYRSHTDTETIIHLWEEEGPRCVERLQGMFAFAIWDERKRELFLARDRLGVKPLYYSFQPGGLVFGSEIKALLEHPAVVADLDEDAFSHYLTFACTPAPTTLFAGIRKLAPAERMIVRPDGSSHTETYWSPFSDRAAAEVAELDEAGAQERLIELLRASIAKRMMADVPFGVFLSGGVDSSTNVALMSELTDPVRTFSVAFADYPQYNELDHARRIADRYKTDHHEVIIDSDDLESFIPELIYHQDEPIADWVCVPLYFVSQLARSTGTIVVQIGEGSDEIFHGYEWLARHVQFQRRYAAPLARLPRPLRHGVGRLGIAASRRVGRGESYAQLLSRAAHGRQPFLGGAVVYDGDLKQKVLTRRPYADSLDVTESSWREAESAGADLLQKMTYVELKRRLPELLLMRVDKMTMATSVEARVPFLDHDLVEFAVALPPDLKQRNGVGKYLLKKAVEPLLPHDLVYRRKQGFGAPVAEWFRGDFGERAQRAIRESSLAERGLLDYDTIDALWGAHRRGANWGMQLWNLLNVSAWHDYWVAGRDGAWSAPASVR
jgi:asparagine synthase (glutamine-hydrolysing)